MAIPLILSKAGRLPRDPADIRATLVAGVEATNAGYTANLDLSLIEDIVSTDVFAISQLDQTVTDLINSVSPYAANDAILNQLGAQAGIAIGTPNNASVMVTFTGLAGYIVPKGFTVGDGGYQYATESGGVCDSAGHVTLKCVALVNGTWSIPANTVLNLITSVPAGVALNCNNLAAGVPTTTAESTENYRARLRDANLSPSIGSNSALKTAIKAVAGVIPRSVSVQQVARTTKVLVAGGDPYQVAGAIAAGLFDIGDLALSATPARNNSIAIYDYPDTYTVNFVSAIAQVAEVKFTWGSATPNFVSDASVAAAVQPAIVAYLTSIATGQSINLGELYNQFMTALQGIMQGQYISKLTAEIKIDGVIIAPLVGTNLVNGDPEGYFISDASKITFVRA